MTGNSFKDEAGDKVALPHKTLAHVKSKCACFLEAVPTWV